MLPVIARLSSRRTTPRLRTVHIGLLLLFILAGVSEAQTSEVQLVIMDNFGLSPSGCRVDNFIPEKWSDTLENAEKHDLSLRFSAFRAAAIPRGRYIVFVQCKGGFRASGDVVVSRPDVVAILAATKQKGDDYDLARSVFAVRIKTLDASLKDEVLWVRAIGLFGDANEVAPIAPSTSEARFVGLLPGTYQILLMTAGTVVCSFRVDVAARSEALEIDARSPCSIGERLHL